MFYVYVLIEFELYNVIGVFAREEDAIAAAEALNTASFIQKAPLKQ